MYFNQQYMTGLLIFHEKPLMALTLVGTRLSNFFLIQWVGNYEFANELHPHLSLSATSRAFHIRCSNCLHLVHFYWHSCAGLSVQEGETACPGLITQEANVWEVWHSVQPPPWGKSNSFLVGYSVLQTVFFSLANGGHSLEIQLICGCSRHCSWLFPQWYELWMRVIKRENTLKRNKLTDITSHTCGVSQIFGWSSI